MQITPSLIGVVAIAGALGSLGRWGLSLGVSKLTGPDFPWGTWAVNLLGSLLFGFVWQLADERVAVSPEARFAILTGFLGAFTTFSTFAFESATLIERGSWGLALANVVGQTVIGTIFAFVGIALARIIAGEGVL